MSGRAHWQHSPHDKPGMVTEFVVDHLDYGRQRDSITSSYTCYCDREDCPGVPPGLDCRCNSVNTR